MAAGSPWGNEPGEDTLRLDTSPPSSRTRATPDHMAQRPPAMCSGTPNISQTAQTSAGAALSKALE
eukprot:2844017-Alexandrium_andersonii.AAC.1